MGSNSIFSVINLFAPVFFILTMSIMLVLDIRNSAKGDRRVKNFLLYYFITVILSWGCTICYYFAPSVFVYCNWICYVVMLVSPVAFFEFVFEITKTSSGERVSRWHYVFPAAIGAAVLILTILLPYDVSLAIVLSRGKYSEAVPWYFHFINSKPLTSVFCVLFYMVLMFIRMKKYSRQIQDYASNEKRSSLKWLYFCLSYYLLLLFVAAITSRMLLSSGLALIPICLILVQYTYLTYNTIEGNYIVRESDAEKIPEKPVVSAGGNPAPDMLKKNILSRGMFDEYIASRKPYLDPDLKITDLVGDLGVNRTYISSFINQEYDMNFSRYINGCRMREYETLRVAPESKDHSDEQLSLRAGFGSYAYFTRLKNDRLL